MTPASFAVMTLAALFVVTQVVKLAFDLAHGDPRRSSMDNKIPSGIA